MPTNFNIIVNKLIAAFMLKTYPLLSFMLQIDVVVYTIYVLNSNVIVSIALFITTL